MKLEQLFEASINAAKFEKLWRNKDFQARLVGHSTANEFAEWFRIENPEYENEFIEVITMLPEFEEYFKHQLEERFDDLYYDIEIKNGEIVLYREMTVRRNWIDVLAKNPNSRIGMYWSFDKDAAEAHWGKFDREHRKVSIVIKLKEKYVDWMETFSANLVMPEEKEITLYKNTPFKIIHISDGRGEALDISSIENNTYKA